MKAQSVQRSALVCIVSFLLLCFTSEAALSLRQRAHKKRSHGSGKGIEIIGGHHGDLVGKDEVQKGANEDDASAASNADDDDDDDDDDDEEETSTPAKAVSLKAVDKKDTKKDKKETEKDKKEKEEADAQAKEEAQLKKAISDKEEELSDNLKDQAELKEQIAYLQDVAKSNKEIDAQEKLVANETDSVAMANMLGKMWKEMRMFEMPFYSQHVKEEEKQLKRDEKRLQQELTAAEGNLAAARKRWAAGEKSKKMKVESEEPALEKSKDAKADAKDEDEADSKEEEKKGKKKLSPADEAAEDAEKTVQAEESQLHKWSFWHMEPQQQRAVFMSTITYFVLGTLFALIYRQVRQQPTMGKRFDPKPQPGVSKDSSEQKDFRAGLFDCFKDPNVCFLGCFCPVIRWADTLDKRGRILGYWKAFFIMFILMLLHPYTMAATTVIIWVVGAFYRQKLRDSYNIQKGGKTWVIDLAMWACCQCCAIVQEAREQAYYEGGP